MKAAFLEACRQLAVIGIMVVLLSGWAMAHGPQQPAMGTNALHGITKAPNTPPLESTPYFSNKRAGFNTPTGFESSIPTPAITATKVSDPPTMFANTTGVGKYRHRGRGEPPEQHHGQLKTPPAAPMLSMATMPEATTPRLGFTACNTIGTKKPPGVLRRAKRNQGQRNIGLGLMKGIFLSTGEATNIDIANPGLAAELQHPSALATQGRRTKRLLTGHNNNSGDGKIVSSQTGTARRGDVIGPFKRDINNTGAASDGNYESCARVTLATGMTPTQCGQGRLVAEKSRARVSRSW